MKLLNKQQITNLKSSERKQEIDEGIKLANKIDVLRETASKEEANLAKFRIESLKILHEEISVKAKERDILLAEVLSLRSEREELLSLLKTIKSN